MVCAGLHGFPHIDGLCGAARLSPHLRPLVVVYTKEQGRLCTLLVQEDTGPGCMFAVEKVQSQACLFPIPSGLEASKDSVSVLYFLRNSMHLNWSSHNISTRYTQWRMSDLQIANPSDGERTAIKCQRKNTQKQHIQKRTHTYCTIYISTLARTLPWPFPPHCPLARECTPLR